MRCCLLRFRLALKPELKDATYSPEIYMYIYLFIYKIYLHRLTSSGKTCFPTRPCLHKHKLHNTYMYTSINNSDEILLGFMLKIFVTSALLYIIRQGIPDMGPE